MIAFTRMTWESDPTFVAVCKSANAKLSSEIVVVALSAGESAVQFNDSRGPLTSPPTKFAVRIRNCPTPSAWSIIVIAGFNDVTESNLSKLAS
ncbi:hypothetical protein D3C85_1298500 [compost metagenome]